ncbi:MAG TPA: choice-of-anchor Q domain-containing protein, partial [Polyangium sp.]|nr:choice-of-anchor Q domain-containing protein [Polyangium sp.]
NNIFVNAGTADFAKGFGVYETDAAGTQLIFENNALWVPNGGTLFMQNGATPLLIATINAMQGYGGNIEADPLLDATYHLLPGSPCRNAGKTVAVPLVDFDGDSRPQEMSFDIGADEYVP